MLQCLIITFRFLICGRRFPVTRRCWITWLSRNSVVLLSEEVMGSGGTIRSFESNKYSSTTSHTIEYKIMHLHIFLSIQKMVCHNQRRGSENHNTETEVDRTYTEEAVLCHKEKRAVSWSPHHGQCNKGWPRRRCKTTIEKQAETAVKTWTEVKAIAENIVCWHCFVEPCAPNWSNRKSAWLKDEDCYNNIQTLWALLGRQI